MPITKSCEVCGKEFKVPPVRALTARACSNVCGNVIRGRSNQKRVTLQCQHCKKPFETPVCNADRRIYCSYDCKHEAAEYRSKLSDRFRMEMNPRWKNGVATHADGYLLRKAPEHPFAWSGYVFEHRLIAEEALREADPEHAFLTKLGNQSYLRPGIDVHHVNRVRNDNRITNLVICTPGAHRLIHNGCEPKPGTFWPTTFTLTDPNCATPAINLTELGN